ncbi:mechanosensitive ion channel family protein [Halospeciosus flavus]|uniref:mechanosensitive ion channel family protein n=1 Tax=Halospeciosus flavus TaxID=3032283 RepID=UPI003613DC7F
MVDARRRRLGSLARTWEWPLAIFFVVGGWALGKLLVRLLGRRVARRFQRPSVTRTVLRLIRTGSLAIGAFAALSVFGLGLGDLVLSVTVFSAVLGLVLAPIVGSVINGVFVLADQPYEIGDMIEITDTGQRGFVEDITLRYTKVFTLDNTFLVVPNGSMRERDVINYSAEDERIRLRLSVGVTYESDVAEARHIMEEAAKEVETVLPGGPDIRIGSARYVAAPTARIDEFADSSVSLTLHYWAKEPYKLSKVRSEVQTAIWDAFAAAEDVEIAYPHTHHVFDETSGTARVAVDGDRDGNGRGGETDAATDADLTGRER